MKNRHRIKNVIAIVIFGCAICIVCAFLIAWIGGRYSSSVTVLANEAPTEEICESTEARVQGEALLPQWLFFHSVGGSINDEEKAYLDVLINRWTKGKLSDDELSSQMTEYLNKHNIDISSMGVQSEALSVFPSAEELPDYAEVLAGANERTVYDFIGVYTNGDHDEEGRLICYYWEAGVLGA